MDPNQVIRLDDPLTIGIDGQPIEGFGCVIPQTTMSPLLQHPSVQDDDIHCNILTSSIGPPNPVSQYPTSFANDVHVNQSTPAGPHDDRDLLGLANITDGGSCSGPPSSEISQLQAPWFTNLVTTAQAEEEEEINYPDQQEERSASVENNGLPAQTLLPRQNGFVYREDADVAVSTAGGPESQQITEDEMEEILKKPISIDVSDLIGSSSRKRSHSEDVEDDDEEEQDVPSNSSRSEGNSKPAFIDLGETNEGGFGYRTLRIFQSVCCAYCSIRCPFQQDLDQHIQQKHTTRTKRPYRKRKQERNFRCRFCRRELNNGANLRRHCSVVHTGPITDTCSNCGAQFSSRHGYVVHMRDSHGVIPDSVRERFGSDPYSGRANKKRKTSQVDEKHGWDVRRCVTCDYWTPCKGNMVRHIRGKHLNLRSHQCGKCYSRFNSKSNLQIHSCQKAPGTENEEEKKNDSHESNSSST